MCPVRVLALAFICLLPLAPVRGEAVPPAGLVGMLPDDPSGWLGLAVSEAEARLGEPASRRILAGEAALRDATVADYGNGLSLYAYDGLVWQVRLAEGYQGSIYGIFVGDAEDKIVSTLGTPWSSAGDVVVYRLAWKGYPVRLRIVFGAGCAREIFLYRGDF